jgi:putative tricarboxylic transport membrane protein
MFQPDAIVEAARLFFTLEAFYWLVIGVALGIGIGAIPGIAAVTGVALLLPVSFALPTVPAIALLIGLLKGAFYGGSISAVSFGIPGTPAAAAAVPDGYKLAQKGQGRKALEMALYASVTGDSLADIFTILVAPVMAMVALAFGPTERFWAVTLAILLIGALGGNHLAKGLISGVIGVFIAMIGTDPIGGVARMTFGQWWLMDGIHIIPLVMGLFAMPVVLLDAAKLLAERGVPERARERISGSFWKLGQGLTFREFRRAWKELGIGTSVGIFIGMLPGLGATVAAFLAYGAAKQASRKKKIGTGKLEGIAACESANNATIGPSLIPLIAFGIPGSPTAALIGAALILQGVTPSPLMFDLFPHIVFALFMVLLMANVINLIVGRLFAGLYTMLANISRPLLIAMIFMLATIGTYVFRGNPYDVLVMVIVGLLGWGMTIIDIPAAPLLMAAMITPLMEANLRRALIISGGDWGQALLGSPLAVGLIIAAVMLSLLTIRYLQKAAKEDVEQ